MPSGSKDVALRTVTAVQLFMLISEVMMKQRPKLNQDPPDPPWLCIAPLDFPSKRAHDAPCRKLGITRSWPGPAWTSTGKPESCRLQTLFVGYPSKVVIRGLSGAG